MANIEEREVWEEGIYQIEKSDRVIGGPGGISNIQGGQLANRTQYLRKSLSNLVTDIEPRLVPVGAIIQWGTPTPPDGWLELNGQAFDPVQNPKLAALYPSGHVPDWRGRFTKHASPGEVVGSLVANNIRDHFHVTGRLHGESGKAADDISFPIRSQVWEWPNMPARALYADYNRPVHTVLPEAGGAGSYVSTTNAVDGELLNPAYAVSIYIIKTDKAESESGAAGPSNLIISPSSIKGATGAQIQLTATVLPDEVAAQYPVSYRSSDTSVCTVNAAGLVTLTGPGTATIIATISTGLAFTVPVTSERYLTTLAMAAIPNIAEGDEYQIILSAAPTNYTEAINYSSSNTDVALITSEGVINAVAHGTCMITATGASSGVTTSRSLTVTQATVTTPYLITNNVLSEIADKGTDAQKQARENIDIKNAASEIWIPADTVNNIPAGTLPEVLIAIASLLRK